MSDCPAFVTVKRTTVYKGQSSPVLHLSSIHNLQSSLNYYGCTSIYAILNITDQGLLFVPRLGLVTLEVVVAELIARLRLGNNAKPVTKLVLLQKLLCQVLEVALGKLRARLDGQRNGAIVLADGNVVSEVVHTTLNLDAVLQKCLKVSSVKDTVGTGTSAVDGNDLGGLANLLGCTHSRSHYKMKNFTFLEWGGGFKTGGKRAKLLLCLEKKKSFKACEPFKFEQIVIPMSDCFQQEVKILVDTNSMSSA